jgi:V8-like Glu-specific endopeptidase
MKLAALLALVLSGCGCVSLPTPSDLRLTTLRIETDNSVCSATAVGPYMLLTATHCLGSLLRTVEGHAVEVVKVQDDHKDHALVTVSGIRFRHWAHMGPVPKQGDRIRWWGNPLGEPDVYREGYVAKVRDDAIFVDATVCHGDSGSGLFNDAGQLVGVLSAMTDESGCTFMVARR